MFKHPWPVKGFIVRFLLMFLFLKSYTEVKYNILTGEVYLGDSSYYFISFLMLWLFWVLAKSMVKRSDKINVRQTNIERLNKYIKRHKRYINVNEELMPLETEITYKKFKERHRAVVRRISDARKKQLINRMSALRKVRMQ